MLFKHRFFSVVSLCCFMVFAWGTVAYAGIEPYLTGKFFAGTQMLKLGMDTSSGYKQKSAYPFHWGGGVALGVLYDAKILGFRSEVEYLYKRTANIFTVDPHSIQGKGKISLNSHGILANFYMDITLVPIVKPYISAGIGVAIHDMKYVPSDIEFSRFKKTETSFAWQTGLGMYCRLGKVALDVNLRYTYSDPVYIRNGSTVAYASPHAFEAFLGIMLFL